MINFKLIAFKERKMNIISILALLVSIIPFIIL